MARQRGLLLEKLEDFRQMNKSLRQKLKRLQATEVGSKIMVLENVQLLFRIFTKTVFRPSKGSQN